MFYQLFTSGFLPALGALEDGQAVMATAGQGHRGGKGEPVEIRPEGLRALGLWSLPSWQRVLGDPLRSLGVPSVPQAPPVSHWPIPAWAPWSCSLGRHGGSNQECEVK